MIMHRIFISYKRVDKDKVFPIVEEIKQKTGVDCWIDLEGIESGDQFQNVIIEAIDRADIVIFMLSKNFIAPYRDGKTGKIDLKKQTFPEKEVMYALAEGKRLIPLSIDGTTVNDCKWLKFNCAGLDCIDWGDAKLKNKLLRNLIKWTNLEYDENTLDVGDCQYSDNKYFHLRINNPIHFWGYVSTILVFLALVLFGVYVRQSPEVLYLNVKGLSEDSLVAIPHSIKDLETSEMYKLTCMLDDVGGSDRKNKIYSKIRNLSVPALSICIGKSALSSIRAIIGKKDIHVDVKIEKNGGRYIATILMKDWRGKQYEKTVEGDGLTLCIEKMSAFMSLPYSPLLSVLYDYSPLKNGEEYLQNNLWKEELYSQDERANIMKEAIEEKIKEYYFGYLILALHYENMGNMTENHIKLARDNYELFMPFLSVDGNCVESIEERIKYLKDMENRSNLTVLSLPEKLMKEGILPSTHQIRQLVMVVNQREKWVHNRKCPKGTLYTFEKHENYWKEKFAPFEVNLSVKGITSPDTKIEGDFKIPSGFYALPFVFGYERDVNTKMKFITLNYDHVWVCDSTDEKYNQFIEDTDGSYKKNPNELLKRNDHLYKYVIVIGYNMNPIVKGKGSAIFLHVERRKDSATAGCIAISEDRMKQIIEWLDPMMQPHIYISKNDIR